jgi:hypothetical protein
MEETPAQTLTLPGEAPEELANFEPGAPDHRLRLPCRGESGDRCAERC